MYNFIIITGPTGVGKTELSLKLALKLNTEIISADSMQIYKGLDIGTAKISYKEKQIVNHHLIDICELQDNYTVKNFRDDAFNIISKLNFENKLALVVGGTGLYLNSLIYNLDFSDTKSNENLRNSLISKSNKYGNDYLYNLLLEIDPNITKKIHKNQTKRIIRALEVYYQTGKLFSELNDYEFKLRDDVNFLIFQLDRSRDIIYKRINKRVSIMLNQGLIEETLNLVKSGYRKDIERIKAIGNKEVLYYLDGLLSYSELEELIQKNTRHYAKRQLTWFKRYENRQIINLDDNSVDTNLERIINIIRGKYEQSFFK